MPLGMIGIKLGMTQVFDEGGRLVPVTLIEAGPNYVSQVKTEDADGYVAVQLAYGVAKRPRETNRKRSRLRKPDMGHLAAAGLGPMRWLREFRVEDVGGLNPGDVVACSMFSGVSFVDVTGVSKGRGFTGTIKRHNFSRGPMTHGSKSHRRPASIGSSATPSRVFKGKRMPGRYGADTVTVQNLRLIKIDEEKGIMFVKGAVPGANGSRVFIRPSVKRAA